MLQLLPIGGIGGVNIVVTVGAWWGDYYAFGLWCVVLFVK
jgi:hypothetical protein